MAQPRRPATSALAEAAIRGPDATAYADNAASAEHSEHEIDEAEAAGNHRVSARPNSESLRFAPASHGTRESRWPITQRAQTAAPEWVAETRFGKWFLGTDTWLKYVLTDAVADLQSLAAPHLPDSIDRLMDIGCGQGTAFPLLRQAFAPAQLLGVDVDPDMLTSAGELARSIDCPVELQHGSVTRLNLPDSSIDVVFCHQLIHHVADQVAALQELHRVLKPGGLLMLSESCAAFIGSWPVRWLFRHPPGVQNDAGGYLELLRSTGFEFNRSDVRTYSPWWSLPDLGLRRRLGLAQEPDVATELMAVARRASAHN